MESLPPDYIPQITHALTVLRHRRSSMIGALALFAYDPFLTMKQESKYIWRAKWSVSKVVYLLLRYGSIATQSMLYGKYLFGTNVPPSHCKLIGYLDAVAGILIEALIQLTIALRTSALYQNQRSVSLFLAVVYVLSISAQAYNSIEWNAHVVWVDMANGLEFGCVGICAGCQPWIRVIWIPVVFFDSILLAMTVHKALQHGKIFSTRLLTALYRDGFSYFLVLYTTEVLLFIVFNAFSADPAGTGFTIGAVFIQGFLRAMVSVGCCRMILNLRGVLSKPSEFDMAPNTGRVTTLRFAPQKDSSNSGGTTTTSYTTSQAGTSSDVQPAKPALGGVSEDGNEVFELVAPPPRRTASTMERGF